MNRPDRRSLKTVAPTSCCAAILAPTGCRGLGGRWLASDTALSDAVCIAGKPPHTSCLRSHPDTDRLQRSGWELACQLNTALSDAVCIAGKPHIQAACAAILILTGCRGLGGSWLASDRALSDAVCIVGKPHKALTGGFTVIGCALMCVAHVPRSGLKGPQISHPLPSGAPPQAQKPSPRSSQSCPPPHNPRRPPPTGALRVAKKLPQSWHIA